MLNLTVAEPSFTLSSESMIERMLIDSASGWVETIELSLPITSTEGNLFFQLISELQEQTSIIITTNKGFEEWAEFLDDAALATAILDRLSYRCDRIQMSGKSYRLENRKSFLSKGDATDEI